jgi:two-component system phosphate regulon response regulator PhoB
MSSPAAAKKSKTPRLLAGNSTRWASAKPKGSASVNARNGKRRILVAIAEPPTLDLVRRHLATAGFDVVTACDGMQALEKFREAGPALAILDVTLPGRKGHEVLRTIRSEPLTRATPVIMISEQDGGIDSIISLELGADDHVSKPISPKELTLRARAILSRCVTPSKPSAVSAVGKLRMNREHREVLVGRKPVDLTGVEFRLLSALMQASGEVLSRERLIQLAWGAEQKTQDRTVDTHLRRLRKKLGAAKDHVETVRGVGYRVKA